ncbi:ABC transporter ATP-binding protein [Alkalicoccus chagannorensis]|uniref:ABC transporter ATP-binding protein n=1 Tax=Alkalicoccus chagannorensis TaxID=427072 RepID=UPI00040EDD6F|nr:ABC transporter ATP-binding protein [Alkalicoccus chagannorensis]
MLTIHQAEKQFDQLPVFRGVSFTVKAGETASLVGPSGCGKTTLLRTIAGLERLSSGTMQLHGRDMTSVPPEKRPVVLLFQDALLFPHLTVLENVLYGLKYGKRRLSRKKRNEEAETMLAKVEMTGWKDHYPAQLSGGQQQRVSLARALLLQPELLLLDEPFSSLDAHLRQQLRLWVRRFLKQEGVTALFVTHDREEAVMMGDHLLVMKDGLLQQEGAPEDVYTAPVNEAVADVISDGLYCEEGFIGADRLQVDPEGELEAVVEHALYAYGWRFYRLTVHTLSQTVVVHTEEELTEGTSVKLSVKEVPEHD